MKKSEFQEQFGEKVWFPVPVSFFFVSLLEKKSLSYHLACLWWTYRHMHKKYWITNSCHLIIHNNSFNQQLNWLNDLLLQLTQHFNSFTAVQTLNFGQWLEATIVTNQDRQAYNVHEHVYWKAGSLWAPERKWT